MHGALTYRCRRLLRGASQRLRCPRLSCCPLPCRSVGLPFAPLHCGDSACVNSTNPIAGMWCHVLQTVAAATQKEFDPTLYTTIKREMYGRWTRIHSERLRAQLVDELLWSSVQVTWSRSCWFVRRATRSRRKRPCLLPRAGPRRRLPANYSLLDQQDQAVPCQYCS